MTQIWKLAVACAFAATAIPALAADLPAPAPLYKAASVAAPSYSWTGFYLGLNAGYGWGDRNFQLFNGDPAFYAPALAAGPIPATVAPNPQGFIGGGQAGYNIQSGLVVYGMGEKSIVDIARRLAGGQTVRDLRDLRGVAYVLGASETPFPPTDQGPWGPDALLLPSYEQVKADKLAFVEATRVMHINTKMMRNAMIQIFPVCPVFRVFIFYIRFFQQSNLQELLRCFFTYFLRDFIYSFCKQIRSV